MTVSKLLSVIGCFLSFQIPEEHDLESQIRKEREWRFLRNTRVRKQAQQVIQKGKSSQRGGACTQFSMVSRRPRRVPYEQPTCQTHVQPCTAPTLLTPRVPMCPLAVKSFSRLVQTGSGSREDLAWGQGRLGAEGLLGLHFPWAWSLQGRPSARPWLLAAFLGSMTSALWCFQREGTSAS